MKLAVLNAEGKELRKLDVDDSVFGIEPNGPVLHQAFVTQRNNQRWGTARTKTRGEVVGSTRKVRRQKGTGGARAGSENSPTRVGGGTAFGPRPRDYSQALPKKMRRLAIRSALSGKAADGQLVVIDQLAFDAPKTKEIMRILRNVGIDRSALIVTGEPDRMVLVSTRNLEKTKVLPARYLNVADMMNHKGLLMTEDAIRVAESLWAIKAPAKPKLEPRRSLSAKTKVAVAAPVAEAPAAAVEEEAKPGRRTRFVPKPEAESGAPAAEKPTRKPRAPKAGAPAAEAKAKPARKTRAPKADASATEEKPKRATRAAKKADDKPAADAPKPRRQTAKKTEEGEG
jgi:large subunit ribosomal protein L4